ncbi:MAG: hypothetical protein ACPGJS_00685 [Flammeovirgaceae bacterium]
MEEQEFKLVIKNAKVAELFSKWFWDTQFMESFVDYVQDNMDEDKRTIDLLKGSYSHHGDGELVFTIE